jgi:hypothetical protein
MTLRPRRISEFGSHLGDIPSPGRLTGVKLVTQVKLLPSPEQAAALSATLAACNQAANRVAGQAYRERVFSRAKLQKLVYRELKAAGLSAQPALHVIRKTADAYKTLHALIDTGLLGHEGANQRRKAESKPISFRPHAAQPFDDRCLSWQYEARTVSIWSVHGRLRGITFTGRPSDLKTLAQHRKGESDLVYRNGMWFLYATCEIGCTAPGQAQAARSPARHQHQSHHLQADRGRCPTHRTRHRCRAARRDPRPGPAQAAPAGHALQLAVPPTRHLPGLQSPAGRSAVP